MVELDKKVSQSLKLLEKIGKDRVLNLGFSGGKDSVVILDLAVRSGIDFCASHAITTRDAPGTLDFIRKNYQDVSLKTPDTTYGKLIQQRGFPSRLRRFCCEELKERYGIGKHTIEGMRADESQMRGSYEPEQCDTRKSMKGAKHILPILNWSESDVWDYIRKRGLPYMKYYDAPYCFKRHGCIGCPLANQETRIKEFKLFPKYAAADIRNIEIYMSNKPHTVLANTFNDGYEAFYFHLIEMSIDDFKRLRSGGLFGFNAKEIVKKQFQL